MLRAPSTGSSDIFQPEVQLARLFVHTSDYSENVLHNAGPSADMAWQKPDMTRSIFQRIFFVSVKLPPPIALRRCISQSEAACQFSSAETGEARTHC